MFCFFKAGSVQHIIDTGNNLRMLTDLLNNISNKAQQKAGCQACSADFFPLDPTTCLQFLDCNCFAEKVLPFCLLGGSQALYQCPLPWIPGPILWHPMSDWAPGKGKVREMNLSCHEWFSAGKCSWSQRQFRDLQDPALLESSLAPPLRYQSVRDIHMWVCVYIHIHTV